MMNALLLCCVFAISTTSTTSTTFAATPLNFSGHEWMVDLNKNAVWVDEHGMHILPRHIHEDDDEIESWWNIDLSLNSVNSSEVGIELEFWAPFLLRTEDAMLKFVLASKNKNKGIYFKMARAKNVMIVKHNNNPLYSRKNSSARRTVYIDDVHKMANATYMHTMCLKQGAPSSFSISQHTNYSMKNALNHWNIMLQSEYVDHKINKYYSIDSLRILAHSEFNDDDNLDEIAAANNEIVVTRFSMTPYCEKPIQIIEESSTANAEPQAESSTSDFEKAGAAESSTSTTDGADIADSADVESSTAHQDQVDVDAATSTVMDQAGAAYDSSTANQVETPDEIESIVESSTFDDISESITANDPPMPYTIEQVSSTAEYATVNTTEITPAQTTSGISWIITMVLLILIAPFTMLCVLLGVYLYRNRKRIFKRKGHKGK